MGVCDVGIDQESFIESDIANTVMLHRASPEMLPPKIIIIKRNFKVCQSFINYFLHVTE